MKKIGFLVILILFMSLLSAGVVSAKTTVCVLNKPASSNCDQVGDTCSCSGGPPGGHSPSPGEGCFFTGGTSSGIVECDTDEGWTQISISCPASSTTATITCFKEDCGNGVLDEEELCDPTAPSENTCPGEGTFSECGAVGTANECECIPKPDVCGNSVIDSGEECDPGICGGNPVQCSNLQGVAPSCPPSGEPEKIFCQLPGAGNPCQCVGVEDIPEFSTYAIFAAIVVIGLGTAFIVRRKKK